MGTSSTASSEPVSFDDALPVDYTAGNVDDGGLINRQAYKCHRPFVREASVPHRKSNPRRVIERANRRLSRPYLNLGESR